MLSKNAIKYYSTLLHKKYRDRERKFIVEGKRLVIEALNSSLICEIVLVTENFISLESKLVEELKSSHRVEVVKEVDFKRLSDTQSPQGILAVLEMEKLSFIFEPKSNVILAMENISDPGNVGTIIRNADWFGIQQIILSEDCAEIFNPKVLRASMGSVFHLEHAHNIDFYLELTRLKENGYKIIVADMDGENIYNFIKPDKFVIVVCNEAHGPSNKLLEPANAKITIPQKGKAESLNVASASAVILNELTK
ncbi:MAG: RNA methyltransferase [Melioribacteraceae bacterium]|nr:RNA methyltransferase [Melioribacteraceae bacterium]